MNDALLEVFLGRGSATTPKKKNTYVCNEEDWKLIRDVFPESGFITYLPGLIVHILADECRKQNVTGVTDRNGTPLESITRVLSSFRITGQEHQRDGRSGA